MFRDIVSFLFSMLDCAAVMLLIMGVFRIEFKANYGRFLVANILHTAISMFLIYMGLHTEALLLQILVMILIFRFIFSENRNYSIWITVTGFTTFLMIQGLLTYLLLYVKLLAPEDLQPFTIKGYMVQTSVFIICMSISLFLKKMKEGFMFDFDSRFKPKKKNSSATLYVVVAIILAVFMSVFYPQLYNSSITVSFYITLLFSIISFLSLIYFSIRRNQEEISGI